MRLFAYCLLILPLALSLLGCSTVSETDTASGGGSGAPPAVPSAGESWTAGEKTGTISDSLCGPSHAGMLRTGSMGADDASCTVKCVEAGSQFVLVESGTGKIYRLLDQSKPRELAGKSVRITGQINEAARIIRPESLIPAGDSSRSTAPVQ
ncbi:MAG TPA: hypothetical protein V6D08_04615 [Candidatus Obscuribacterales bacterium]